MRRQLALIENRIILGWITLFNTDVLLIFGCTNTHDCLVYRSCVQAHGSKLWRSLVACKWVILGFTSPFSINSAALPEATLSWYVNWWSCFPLWFWQVLDGPHMSILFHGCWAQTWTSHYYTTELKTPNLPEHMKPPLCWYIYSCLLLNKCMIHNHNIHGKIIFLMKDSIFCITIRYVRWQ